MKKLEYWAEWGFHQMGQGEYAEVTAEDVLKRMKEATGTPTMRELANWLGAETLVDIRLTWAGVRAALPEPFHSPGLV